MDLHDELNFCGLPVAPHPVRQGALVISGPRNAAYADFCRSSKDYAFKPLENPFDTRINPDLICGIEIAPYDLVHPEAFWSMHKQGGTAESFQAMARLIDEAEKAGEDAPDEIRACKAVYLDLDRPDALQVYEAEGFFWIQASGRHRAIAARLAGVLVPARIVGQVVRTAPRP